MKKLEDVKNFLTYMGYDIEYAGRPAISFFVSGPEVIVTDVFGDIFVHSFPNLWVEKPGRLDEDSRWKLREVRKLIILIGDFIESPVYFSTSRESRYWETLQRCRKFKLIFTGVNKHSGNIVKIFCYNGKE